MYRNNSLEAPGRCQIDENSVLEASRSRWIDKNSVLEVLANRPFWRRPCPNRSATVRAKPT